MIRRYMLMAAALALAAISGCSWFGRQGIEVCVVYKGRQICAKRVDGVWSFSGDLTPEERERIIRDVEGER